MLKRQKSDLDQVMLLLQVNWLFFHLGTGSLVDVF